MSKTILGALCVLAGLLVVWVAFKPNPYASRRTAGISEGFQRMKQLDPKEVAKIVISKGKGTVELKKEGDAWVVASSYGYPADDQMVDKILKGLAKMALPDEPSGTSSESHEDFEVNKESGGFLTFYSKYDKALGSLVVGKYAQGFGIGSNKIFVRVADENATYAVETDIRSDARLYDKDAESKRYLLTEIVKLYKEKEDEVEVDTVRLVRPDKADVIVERRYKEVPVEKPKEEAKVEDTKPDAVASPDGEAKDGEKKAEEKKAEEKKAETKKEEYFVVTSGSEVHEVGKSEEWTARGLVNRGKSIRVEDAVEPKPLSEYGLDKPQLKAIVSYRKKDAPESELKRLTILLGNEKKDEKGETKGYYFTLEGDEYKNRIYLIDKYSFEGWSKEVKDFLPKPKEEPKPAEAKPGEAKPAESAPAQPAPSPPAAPEAPKTEGAAAPAPAPPATGAPATPPAGAPPPTTPASGAPATPAPPGGAATSPAGAPTMPAGGAPTIPPPPTEAPTPAGGSAPPNSSAAPPPSGSAPAATGGTPTPPPP